MTAPLNEHLGGKQYRVAVVLGSGLSGLAASLVTGEPIPYREIGEVPESSIEGHEGALYAGDVNGTATLVFAGRVHLYEGFDGREVTDQVRAAVGAGCQTIVLTNAAGGIGEHLEVGAPCLISDHLNLTGANPLTGPPDEGRPRFLDLTEVYDKELRALAHSVDGDMAEAVYAALPGPTYETPAEVRMLATLGADLVGMSTVLEAIVARHLGARVLGISVVSNRAAGLSGKPLSHEEVAAAAARASGRLEHLLRELIPQL